MDRDRRMPSSCFPSSFTHRIPSAPTTAKSPAARRPAESSSLTVFKPGTLFTSVLPPSFILARHQDCGGKNLKDRQLLSDLPLPIPSCRVLWLLTPNINPSSVPCSNLCVPEAMEMAVELQSKLQLSTTNVYNKTKNINRPTMERTLSGTLFIL